MRGVALIVNVFEPMLYGNGGRHRDHWSLRGIVGLNTGSATKVTPTYAVYSAPIQPLTI